MFRENFDALAIQNDEEYLKHFGFTSEDLSFLISPQSSLSPIKKKQKNVFSFDDYEEYSEDEYSPVDPQFNQIPINTRLPNLGAYPGPQISDNTYDTELFDGLNCEDFNEVPKALDEQDQLIFNKMGMSTSPSVNGFNLETNSLEDLTNDDKGLLPEMPPETEISVMDVTNSIAKLPSLSTLGICSSIYIQDASEILQTHNQKQQQQIELNKLYAIIPPGTNSTEIKSEYELGDKNNNFKSTLSIDVFPLSAAERNQQSNTSLRPSSSFTGILVAAAPSGETNYFTEQQNATPNTMSSCGMSSDSNSPDRIAFRAPPLPIQHLLDYRDNVAMYNNNSIQYRRRSNSLDGGIATTAAGSSSNNNNNNNIVVSLSNLRTSTNDSCDYRYKNTATKPVTNSANSSSNSILTTTSAAATEQLQQGKEDAASSRASKSLATISRRFVEHFGDASTFDYISGNLDVDDVRDCQSECNRVDGAAETLGVHVRRIYELIKILEILSLVDFTGDKRGQFSWRGTKDFLYTLGTIQADAVLKHPDIAYAHGLRQCIDEPCHSTVPSVVSSPCPATPRCQLNSCGEQQYHQQQQQQSYNNSSSSSYHRNNSNIATSGNVDVITTETMRGNTSSATSAHSDGTEEESLTNCSSPTTSFVLSRNNTPRVTLATTTTAAAVASTNSSTAMNVVESEYRRINPYEIQQQSNNGNNTINNNNSSNNQTQQLNAHSLLLNRQNKNNSMNSSSFTNNISYSGASSSSSSADYNNMSMNSMDYSVYGSSSNSTDGGGDHIFDFLQQQQQQQIHHTSSALDDDSELDLLGPLITVAHGGSNSNNSSSNNINLDQHLFYSYNSSNNSTPSVIAIAAAVTPSSASATVFSSSSAAAGKYSKKRTALKKKSPSSSTKTTPLQLQLVHPSPTLTLTSISATIDCEEQQFMVEGICKSFLQLFLLGLDSIGMNFAIQKLVPMQENQTVGEYNKQSATKIRRVYDVANVLCSLNLITKITAQKNKLNKSMEQQHHRINSSNNNNSNYSIDNGNNCSNDSSMSSLKDVQYNVELAYNNNNKSHHHRTGSSSPSVLSIKPEPITTNPSTLLISPPSSSKSESKVLEWSSFSPITIREHYLSRFCSRN